jgi:hypothetical protein
VPKTYDGEKKASAINVAGKTVYLQVENWKYILVQYQFYMDQLPSHKAWNLKLIQKKSREVSRMYGHR